jgi:antitoxin MazE
MYGGRTVLSTMMRTAIRKLGNSSGVIIPKAMLAEIGLAAGDAVDLSLQDGRIAITPVKRRPREGWAAAFAKIGNSDTRILLGSSLRTRATTSCTGAPEPRKRRSRPNARGGVARSAGFYRRQRHPDDTSLPDRVAARNQRRLACNNRAPMTTGSRPAPSRIPVRFQGGSGLILLEQVRVLDKRRLIRQLSTLGPRYAEPHARNAARDVRGIAAAIVGPPPELAANDRPVDLFHREAGSELDCQNIAQIGSISLGVDDVWGRIALLYRLESR